MVQTKLVCIAISLRETKTASLILIEKNKCFFYKIYEFCYWVIIKFWKRNFFKPNPKSHETKM